MVLTGLIRKLGNSQSRPRGLRLLVVVTGRNGRVTFPFRPRLDRGNPRGKRTRCQRRSALAREHQRPSWWEHWLLSVLLTPPTPAL